MCSKNYGAQGLGSPAMSGPYTFSNYGTCAKASGCGASMAGGMADAPVAQRQRALAAMSVDGTLSYGSMGRDACGLAAGLPSGATWGGETTAAKMSAAAARAAPASQPELGNQRIASAPSTAGLDSSGVLYDWRRNAWRYQPGMVYREWTDRQRAAAGIDDPWGNQTARQFAVDVGQGWAGVVSLSGVKTAGVLDSPQAAAINYSGQPLAAAQDACTPDARGLQSMFQEKCVASPQAYGSYKQYGMEPDYFRTTPFAVVYSNPSANPQAFSVATSLPSPATPQGCISQTQ